MQSPSYSLLLYSRLFLLHKDEKPSVWSVRPHRAHNFAVSRRIHSGLARNESHVFWHQQVFFEKFLTAAVRRPRRFERRSVVLYVNETSIEVLKLQSAAVMWSGFETQHFLFFIVKKVFLKLREEPKTRRKAACLQFSSPRS